MFHGPVAQLVERLHGMQEVRGSSPLGSTLRSLLKVKSFAWHSHTTSSQRAGEKIAKCAPRSATSRIALRRATLCVVGHFMFYVYIIQLENKSFYVGYSSNLKQRIGEHWRGKADFTKNFKPVKLVFYAAFLSKTKALAFEKYLKSSSGFAFRNKRLI